jgi:Spy/CpxP family protein refolding chaperone
MMTSRSRHHWGWWVAGVLLILGIVTGGVTGAGAQQQQPPLPTLEQLRWNEIQQKLGLTDQQVSTLQSLRAANRSTMQSDFQAVRTAQQALRAAWGQADAGAISTAAGQVQAARTQLFTDRLQNQLKILNYLGPDLWKQWTALHKHHRGMRGGHGGWMGF